MKNGAIYARYSSDNQREESIFAQVRAIKEWAQRNDIHIAKVYKDEARSGKSDNREAFLQMINEAALGLFEVVLVHKKDRFARNRYDHAIYKRKLQKANVKLISITENLDDSPESIILESVLEGMSEYYSRNLAREVMKGMKENAHKCLFTGGRPPLGYDVNEKKEYIINESEAAAVRLIFKMYLEGYGYGEIINELTIRGYKTKLGKPFAKNGIYEILRNPKYAGIYVFNRAPSRDQEGKRNNHARKSEEDLIIVEDGVPAIITKEQFADTKITLDKRKHQAASFKAKELYLLTGKLFCGECGSAIVGNGSTKNGIRYSYYECNNRVRTKTCSNKRVKKEYIENHVLNKLQNDIFNEDKVSFLAKKLNRHMQEQNASHRQEMLELEKHKNEITHKLDNLIKMVEEGLGTKSIIEKIKSYEEMIDELDFKILDLDKAKGKVLVTEEMIKSYLLKNSVDIKQKDPVECKAIVEKYVDKIVVTDEAIEVTLSIILDTDGVGGGT